MVLKILLLWLFLLSSYSKAETLNTGNLLDEADTWDQTGLVSSDTCSYSGTLDPGQVCFGHSNTRGEVDGGGTITSDQISLINDGGLSIQELNQGFEMSYGFGSESHISNANLPSCIETSGDCRDIIDYTLTLTDPDGITINTFNHYIELDYGGLKDYQFSQTIDPNNYADIFSQVSIYGVDAGYTGGYYGAIINDPYLAIEYTTYVLIDEIIDIIDDAVEQIDIPDVVEIEIDLPEIFDQPIEIEIEITDIELPDLEVVQEIEIIEVIEIEVADAQTMEMNMEIEMEIEMELEMELEQEMEAAIEETIQENIDEPSEPEPTTDDVEGSEPEETTEEETEPEPEEQEQEEEPRETLTAEKKQEVKEKIVKKIMEKTDKNNPGSQAQTMALMAILTDTQAFNEYTSKELIEPIAFQNQSLPVQEMIPDPYGGLFESAQNNLMEQLINSQY